jgi:SAM-dependent methyltransferase
MRWRVEVARRLQTHLEVAPGTRIVVIGRGKRDIDVLCEVLPGAIGFRLSGGRLVGDDARESIALVPVRWESTGGQALAVPAGGACGDSFCGGSLPAEGALDLVVVWLVMMSLPTARRRRLLAEVRRALRVGGTLVVVDHNKPRTWWQRLSNVGWCLLHGVEPCARPAYPAAREVKDADFERISLRLAFRERVQIVRGMRPALASEIDGTHDAGNETLFR